MSIGTSDHDIHSLGTQCTLVIENRMISVNSKNEVIPLPIFGEIFLGVINDPVCTNRAHHVHIPGAAHASDFSPERFGNLHRKRTHTARRTINQNLLPWLNLSLIAETLQCSDCRNRDGRSLLKRYIGRFQRQSIFSGTRVLGKGSIARAEHLVVRFELRYIFANRFNPPRYVSANFRAFWFQKPSAHESGNERFTSHQMPVK